MKKVNGFSSNSNKELYDEISESMFKIKFGLMQPSASNQETRLSYLLLLLSLIMLLFAFCCFGSLLLIKGL